MLRRLARAVLLRCPRCGSRGIIQGLDLVASCPACAHRFTRQEGYWLGAIAINTIVTIGVFGAVFVGWMVLAWPDPPWTTISITVIAITGIFPILFHPWSKTLWVALDLSMHPADER